MEDTDKDKKKIARVVEAREITTEMEESYLDYAMSVIVSRALPDVRDGLKPVQRRILYAMSGLGLNPDSRFRKSAAVVGECFIKNTLILTKRGLVPIQGVQTGDKVYTQAGLRKVIQLYEMPKKPLLKVSLNNGLSNIVTPSQKFKVLTKDWKFEWKEAKELKKEDYLVTKAEYPEIKRLVKLRRVKKNQPRHLNKNIAYLLGLILADGSISNDYGRGKLPRINFCLGDELEIARQVVSLFKQEFNYQPTIEVRHYQYRRNLTGKILNHKKYNLRINRKLINQFFVDNFLLEGAKAPIKEIPLQIFRSPSEVIFSFISGLIDGDGHVHKKGKTCLSYSSVSETLIDQLLVLLHHQGIISSKYFLKKSRSRFINGREIQTRCKPYSLEVRGAAAIRLIRSLNLVSKRKKLRSQNYIDDEDTRRDCGLQYDIIPYASRIIFGELSQNHLGAGWYQDINGEKFRSGVKYKTGRKIRYSSDLQEKALRKTQIIDWGIENKLERIGSPLFEFLEQVIENKLHFIKVSSVEKVKAQKTYDFQVEGKHEFVANGIVSHNCLAHYHPHGDMAVYNALVRMAQDFSLRYPLVQGQGNFGSIDSDPPAAPRYTECRLSKMGQETLRDIEKDTVDFVPNYDGSREEPKVLPSPLFNLLLNGSTGIAVGMATDIPPHNLREVGEALIHLIGHPQATTTDLLHFVQGPDFPTGGIIYNGEGLTTAYSTGRGSVVVRGKVEITEEKGKTRIIIQEIPYRVVKSDLVRRIADLAINKTLTGVKVVRDESDREGIRVLIELSSGTSPQRILNQLYKHTNLQISFHLNMVALVNGLQPKTLSLAEMLNYYLQHRQEVITRRTKFDLAHYQARRHILEGLMLALAHIDDVIATIKKSKDKAEARKNLIKVFQFSLEQAEAILEIKLHRLARLERKEIEEELKRITIRIKELEKILSGPKEVRKVMKQELEEAINQYGDHRRTKVVQHQLEKLKKIDLIPLEDTFIVLTARGYIKRMKPENYHSQRRGGQGILGIRVIEGDMVDHLVMASTRDRLLFFTNLGKVYELPVYDIEEASRTSAGRNLANYLNLGDGEKVLAIINEKIDSQHSYLIMVTEQGIVKKTAKKKYQHLRRTGLRAITLKAGDALKAVAETSGKDIIVLTSQKGRAIVFPEKEVRSMGQAARGLKGFSLSKDDQVISLGIAPQGQRKGLSLLVLSRKGYAKKTVLSRYRLQKRGGKGIFTAKLAAKTGDLIFAKLLLGEEELVIISAKGQVIRQNTALLPQLGRQTSGVRAMRLKAGDQVAAAVCFYHQQENEH